MEGAFREVETTMVESGDAASGILQFIQTLESWGKLAKLTLNAQECAFVWDAHLMTKALERAKGEEREGRQSGENAIKEAKQTCGETAL